MRAELLVLMFQLNTASTMLAELAAGSRSSGVDVANALVVKEHYNPETGESLRPDLNHSDPIGPHWDYRDPDGKWWRIFPDGGMEAK